MNLSSITYLFAGFSFLCIALIVRSPFIKRLRFANFISLHRIRNIARPYKVLVQVICYSLSLFLIGKAIWMTIEINRDILWTLAGLGGVLIMVRLFAVTFGDISFFGFELELDQAQMKHIRLLRSPLIMGGAILILLFGVVPFMTDCLMLMEVEKKQLSQHVQEVKAANKDKFKEWYIPRNLLAETKDEIPGQAISEVSFFRNLTGQAGLRYIILGKAGIGKTTFLRQLSLQVCEINSKQVILSYNAGALASAHKIEKYINKTLFGARSWYSMPLTRKVMKNAVILVDGFDEVEFMKRKEFAKQLQMLAHEYPDAAILLTTRPGALETIPSYTKLILEEFSNEQYEIFIKRSRMKGLKKRLDKTLSKGALDMQFVRLLDEKSTLPKELNEEVIEKLFAKFLEKYKFNIIIGGHYAFMSTFRDMEILEELFVDVLTGGIKNESALIRAGRKSICEQFLLQRILRNYHVSEKDPAIAKEALELLTQIAEIEYKKNSSLTKFDFDKGMFRRNFHEDVFANFALQSELIVEKPKKNKSSYEFDNITIDFYFISKVLFKAIQKDPSKTEKILVRFEYYKGTEILPFLIAQFDRAEDIVGSYLTSLIGNVGTEMEIGRHLEQQFPEILLYIDAARQISNT
jgi:NACHT domain